MPRAVLPLFLAAACACTGHGALAQQRPPVASAPNPNIPVSTPEDHNVRTIAYSPHIRVRLVGTIGMATSITFDPNEQVKRVVFGDSGATWDTPDDEEIKQVPLNNHLHLWPKAAGYTTLHVFTQRDGGPDRPYLFAVEARKKPGDCEDNPVGCDDPEATYALIFRYPEDERLAKEREREAERQRRLDEAPKRAQIRAIAQREAARDRLEVDFFNGGGCRTWQYTAEANEAGWAFLMPDQGPTDNGGETAFRYANGRPMPTFYTVAADGKTEQPVLPAVRPDGTAVLPLVTSEIRIRLGDAVMYVHRAKDAPRCPTNPPYDAGVARTVRRAPPVPRVAEAR